MLLFFLLLGRKPIIIVGKMTEIHISLEEGSHQNLPENRKQGNTGDKNICLDLNENRDNKQFGLIQTVKILREELKMVREENE